MFELRNILQVPNRRIILCVLVAFSTLCFSHYYYYSTIGRNFLSPMITHVNKDTKLATNGYLSHQPKDIAPCGEVCSYGGTVPPNTDQICPWPQIHKHFNCDNIMKRMAYRNQVIIDPPPTY
ncbi:hypothetical protein LSH36_145g00007 [Paralvinella palmiformis]|uniref:Uncharacterized protein n=1 Tax=Paralvinella palmiformis TaxID=53620 RepID=A0AAD9JW67_9ANNE|nr:hypothetical protein LSH36_145g00007 [Paralvinella palmiformis]